MFLVIYVDLVCTLPLPFRFFFFAFTHVFVWKCIILLQVAGCGSLILQFLQNIVGFLVVKVLGEKVVLRKNRIQFLVAFLEVI